MLQESKWNHRMKREREMIHVWIPKKMMLRPFPLVWGIASLAVFALFAVATQVQFSRVSNEKIYQATLDTYYSDVRAYDVAVKANHDCIVTIGIRERYRDIFDGISDLFETTANLPVLLLPDSKAAAAYQKALLAGIDLNITDPLAQGLPPLQVSDCPTIPSEPVKPTP